MSRLSPILGLTFAAAVAVACGPQTLIVVQARGLTPTSVDAGQATQVAARLQYACGPVQRPEATCTLTRVSDGAAEACTVAGVELSQAFGFDCSESRFWTDVTVRTEVAPGTPGDRTLSVTLTPPAQAFDFPLPVR